MSCGYAGCFSKSNPAVRLRTGEDLGARPVAEFIAMREKVVASRTQVLVG